MALIFVLLSLLGQIHENPRARAASIYPHPPDPQHLEWVSLEIEFYEQRHFLWWNYLSSLENKKFSVAQKRSPDGWCDAAQGCGGFQYTDADGRFIGKLKLDATLRNPTVLMLMIWEGREVVLQTITEVPSAQLKDTVKLKVIF